MYIYNFTHTSNMKTKTLTGIVIATVTLIAMIMAIITSASEHNVSAQMMTTGDRGSDSFGNMTSGQKVMINGTINLGQTIFDAIGSKVNTSLTQAITTAEQSVGNNSFALAAFGGEQGGYLVDTIILGTPGMKFHKVIVDPGNGQVLASQEISHKEWMKMQQMMHGGGDRASGGERMMMGPPGMMMGK
jgi:hypothetical protein